MISFLKKFAYTDEELVRHIRMGSKKIISLIPHLDMNKKYEVTGEIPTTLLFYSVTGTSDTGGNSSQIIEKLISSGANLHLIENYSTQQKEQNVFYSGTPLQAAITSFRPDLALTLLKHGSIPTQCFYDFIESIYYKMDTDSIYRCAELMLIRGAKPNEFSKNKILYFGETALDILLFRSTKKVDQFNPEGLIDCYKRLITLLNSYNARIGNGIVSSSLPLGDGKYEVTFKRSVTDSYTKVMECLK